MAGAVRQTQSLDRFFQPLGILFFQRAVVAQASQIDMGIETTLPILLKGSGLLHLSSGCLTVGDASRFAGHTERLVMHGQMQVNAIKQGA